MSYIDSHIARIFLKNNLMVHLQRCILYLTATQLTRNFIFASQIMIMKQNVPCEYKESTLTFVSNSTSSVVAFFFISLVCISWWWKWKAARHCTKSRYVWCIFLVKLNNQAKISLNGPKLKLKGRVEVASIVDGWSQNVGIKIGKNPSASRRRVSKVKTH